MKRNHWQLLDVIPFLLITGLFFCNQCFGAFLSDGVTQRFKGATTGLGNVQNMTILCRMKMGATGAVRCQIMGYGGADQNYDYIRFNIGLAFARGDFGNVADNKQVVCSTTCTNVAGTWYSFAVTCDRADVFIFRNGVLMGGTQSGTDFTDNICTMNTGLAFQGVASSAECNNGSLADIIILNKIATQHEIDEYCARRLVVDRTIQQGNWRLDEGVLGNVAVDLIGTNNLANENSPTIDQSPPVSYP